MIIMNQAFMREKENEWLGDVEPSFSALIRFLTRENNGIRVEEIKNFRDEKTGAEVHEMSNGSCYALDDDKRWYMV